MKFAIALAIAAVLGFGAPLAAHADGDAAKAEAPADVAAPADEKAEAEKAAEGEEKPAEGAAKEEAESKPE